MKTCSSMIVVFGGCLLLAGWARGGNGTGSVTQERPAMTLSLTRLDVNDVRLELRYTIKNESDKEIWICNDSRVGSPQISFEAFLHEDKQTLVIRRRYDVPAYCVWFYPPSAEYVRVGPGLKRTESLSFNLPNEGVSLFGDGTMDLISGQPVCARRLILEIGYYVGSLPETIRSILAVADKFPSGGITNDNRDIVKCYFPGLYIPIMLGGLQRFEERMAEGAFAERITILYTEQLLKGERFSQVIVDGVSIPSWGM
jgi:hypothetical protein